MQPLAICTTIYPAGLPYFDDYCLGVITASEHFEAPLHLVLVCDGLEETAIADQTRVLRQSTELHMVPMVGDGPPAARRLMLVTAAALPVAAAVCYDMDDIPDPYGLPRHMKALQTAAISYGDMDLIEQDGRPRARTFFSGQQIPDRVDDPNDLLRRNFMGFTNTAVKREIIDPTAKEIPDDITAVDWWFHTNLLSEGFCAVKTDGPVVSYRSHDQNILGAGGTRDDKKLLRQCKIMREHYAQLPQTNAVRHADAAVERLARMSSCTRAKLPAPPQPGVWYDDVSWACDQMELLK